MDNLDIIINVVVGGVGGVVVVSGGRGAASAGAGAVRFGGDETECLDTT
jgi:hypothetical protein